MAKSTRTTKLKVSDPPKTVVEPFAPAEPAVLPMPEHAEVLAKIAAHDEPHQRCEQAVEELRAMLDAGATTDQLRAVLADLRHAIFG